MRIVIDLQGAQNESRFRGIGRYSLSLARSMAKQAGAHELWLVLNACYPEALQDIAGAFDGLLPPERLRVFEVPGPFNLIHPANHWRIRAAEFVREQFLAQLRPDIVHIASWFEGPRDNTVSSIDELGLGIPHAVTLYDLIPLLRPDSYLPEVRIRNWYFRKTQALRRADLLLAISESSAKEAREGLLIPDENIAVIGAGVDELFRPPQPDPQRDDAIRQRYGLERPFIMYTGAADPRKNLTGLLRALALLPVELREKYLLACAGKMYHRQQPELVRLIKSLGLPESSVRFLGYVPDADLVPLYAMCELFVFPSIHEGFGLPAAEAMACGAPVIGSNTTSVPLVIGRSDSLFDPANPADIARCMAAVLKSPELQADLRTHGVAHAKSFRWDDVGRRAIEAFESVHEQRAARMDAPPRGAAKQTLAIVSPLPDASSTGLLAVVSELARDFDVTWICNRRLGGRLKQLPGIPTRSSQWFRRNGGKFDNVLYTMHDDPRHGFVFPLLETWSGIVVLSDFSTARAISATDGGVTVRAETAIYDSHGLSPLLSGASREQNLPCSEAVFRLSHGVLVHDREQIVAARNLYGMEAEARMRVVPSPHSREHSVRDIARAWRDAIAALSEGQPRLDRRVADAISAIAIPRQPGDLARVAAALAVNAPQFGLPQILVDVSTLAQIDARTGIQRVVRSILAELVSLPPPGWRVEPVRVEGDEYVYARDFSRRTFNLPRGSLPPDAPMKPRRGDIFLGLDLIAHLLLPKRGWFKALSLRGVKIVFVLYDLLPLRRPDLFDSDLPPMFRNWAAIVAEVADSVICISRSVAEDFSRWLSEQDFVRQQAPQVGWFHLGADLEASLPTTGLSPDARSILASLGARPSFLSVGTLEPRKRHAQELDAFELLWADGVDAGLVIVGQRGWRTEELAARIESHRELGRRLFWLRGISDEMLTRVYESATALLTASEGEGFGLPLIEAARHGLPILARDLPVFREVAGDSAAYFTGEDARSLADAIRNWLALKEEGQHPRSEGITAQSWKKSAQQLLARMGIAERSRDEVDRCRTSEVRMNREEEIPGEPRRLERDLAG